MTNPSRSIAHWNYLHVPPEVSERALANASEAQGGCLISNYSVGSHGYAQIGWQENGKTRMVLAHRAAWVARNGQVPPGMTLDHTCKNRTCVNPDHLRVLSNFDNARRTSGNDWPLGQCRNGHPDSELVSYPRTSKNGSRRDGVICRICRADYQRRYRASVKQRKATSQ